MGVANRPPLKRFPGKNILDGVSSQWRHGDAAATAGMARGAPCARSPVVWPYGAESLLEKNNIFFRFFFLNFFYKFKIHFH